MATLLILGAGFAFPMAAQSPAQRPQNFDIGDRFFPKLGDVLTNEQRDSLRNAVVAQRDAIRPLQEKLRASRQALLDAAFSGKFDENLARQNAEASANAEAELTVIYARALSQMRPPLSPQQIQQLKNFQPGHGRPSSEPATVAGPEKHLPLPPPLPRDANDLPIVQ